MPTIAIIGAGSQIFTKTLAMDILATPALRGSELRLMSRTRPKLARMEAFLKRVIRENDLPASVWSTLDRREALRGADYVICLVQVGGVEAFRLDYEIPLKHGVDQCIGDSLGPGGVFRGLRTLPVLTGLVRDMEALCPDALLLNYTNPMGACCHGLGRVARRVQFVGLCHGVQTTVDLISRYTATPKPEIDYLCAGINHMAWFLSLRDKRTGRDLYPMLRRNMEKPEYYVNEKVRGEVMRHFGYFMTESTGHLSEYVPWFRSSERALKLYCDEPSFGGESGAYYRYCAMLERKYRKVNYLDTESPRLADRSIEYGSYVIEAHETDRPFRLNGNVRNDGYIENLPRGCCVEVPLFVDRQGLHPVRVGLLPPACAALNQSNVTVQTLAVEAGLTGDPELAMQAVAMDPLTSTRCTLKEARDLTAELLRAQAQWLPQFRGARLKPTPTIRIPRKVRRVEAPLDPALAIVHRFGELARRKV
jgi:alpha-galactosidase